VIVYRLRPTTLMLCFRSIDLFLFPTHHPCAANNTNSGFIRFWKRSRLEVWCIAYIELRHPDAYDILHFKSSIPLQGFLFSVSRPILAVARHGPPDSRVLLASRCPSLSGVARLRAGSPRPHLEPDNSLYRWVS
jgi:hypothetical protein